MPISLKRPLKFLSVRRLCAPRYILIILLVWIEISTNMVTQSMTSRFYAASDGIFGENVYNETMEHKNCSESTKPNATNYDRKKVTTSIEKVGAFNVAFIIGCICGGIYSDLKGGKNVYYMCVCVYVTVSCIALFVVNIAPLVYILLGMIGFANGAEISARTNLLSHWIPTDHLTTSFMIIEAANSGVSETVNQLSASQAWQLPNWLYYFVTATLLLWLGFFHVNVYSAPHLHPFAKEKEKREMLKYMAASFPASIPFVDILREYRIWSLGFCVIAFYTWSIGTGICCMFFFKVIMSMSATDILETNIVYVATRHSCGVLFALFTDRLIRKRNISVMYLRTLLIAISLIVPGIIRIQISYIVCLFGYSQILYFFSLFFESGLYSNLDANRIDITRHYAGTATAVVMSCHGVFQVISHLLAPIVFYDYNLKEYRNMMQLMTIICITAAFLHYNFTTPSGASWDRIHKTRKSDITDIQTSGTSLNYYDAIIARAIAYVRKHIQRLKARS